MKSSLTNAPMKSVTAHAGPVSPRHHQKTLAFFRTLTGPQRRSLAALCGIGDDPAAINVLWRRLIDWIGAQP